MSSPRNALLPLILLAVLPILLAPAGQAATPVARSVARVALTFDDLPAHGPIPAGSSRIDIATRIIAALRAHKAPAVYGFVNARDLEPHPDDAAVLQAWRDAGMPLGNHAYSHMDLHANTAAAWEQDVLANEATLTRYMPGQDWHWLRYPYLREGDTPEKYRAVRRFLNEHHYRVAQVTLSFNDYAYNEPYARCLEKQDTKGIAWLQESYLARAAESLTQGQALSQTLFERDIPHVMLLHIGGFETVMLPRLLDLLQQRGFSLITLPDASQDDAYKSEPELTGNWNGTLLEQLARARKVTTTPSAYPDTFQKLEALCR
jgi:peptidoglycan/xylan/chitin deacetylase (PgdA/CDA1 family)